MFFLFALKGIVWICLLSTCTESRQEGLALEQLNNLPSNRLEEVQHLIRKGDEVQEPAKAFQTSELWVILKEREI